MIKIVMLMLMAIDVVVMVADVIQVVLDGGLMVSEVGWVKW